MCCRRSTIDRISIGAKSNRWQRERIVIGNLVGFGGAEDEFHVLGRLFQRLEERVEGLVREHVDFVDDVDLEAGPAGADVDVAAELADFVDAAVAGAVDLEHVDVAAAGDALADVALVAGRGRRPVHAVQGLGEDAGGRGLADAASAGEEIGVADAVGGDGVGEGLRDLLLADELAEILRPIAAGDDDVLRIAASALSSCAMRSIAHQTTA